MQPVEDPFLPLDTLLPEAKEISVDFANLANRPLGATGSEGVSQALRPEGVALAPVVARFEGFDALDQPLVSGVAACPGEVLAARSALVLVSAQIGQPVVLLFENGDPRRPLVMGVLAPTAAARTQAHSAAATVLADGERQVIEAEREIVLKCGDASITLTRAGKVIIKGRYILSRSSGVNKIKGATVDIN